MVTVVNFKNIIETGGGVGRKKKLSSFIKYVVSNYCT